MKVRDRAFRLFLHPSALSPRASRLLILAALAALATPAPATPQELPGRFAGEGEIVIGLEYALLNSDRLARGMAEAFAETDMPGMKHYVEAVEWGQMQKGPSRPIDFRTFDRFVREYQIQGFTELTISLKPHSRWASVDVKLFSSTNASPKPEYRELFQDWVQACIERYDGDGIDDMPGLRWPIRYVEIGNEFSSYQPEPVEEYLVTLELAFEAAHRASDDVLVGHAAFLFAPVNMDVDDPSEYDTVWERTPRVDNNHGIEDMRAILDRPEIFDFINIHNLGDPYEIEHLMRWIEYETGLRGYTKPVVISDTVATSYIGWGVATACEGPRLGVISAPATEADRCRLADFFTKLVNKDPAALRWTRGFVAADHVQRSVIAAEQGIAVINLAFVSDIWFLTYPVGRAGAGISAWGGALSVNPWTGQVLDRYPAFYAIRQMMGHLTGYRSIERVQMPNEQARVYRVEGAEGVFWIGWRDPKSALLPEDGTPSLQVRLDVSDPGPRPDVSKRRRRADAPVSGSAELIIEPVITGIGRTEPTRRTVRASNGTVRLQLTHTPVYILPG